MRRSFYLALLVALAWLIRSLTSQGIESTIEAATSCVLFVLAHIALSLDAPLPSKPEGEL